MPTEKRHTASGGERLYTPLPSSRLGRMVTVWCRVIMRLTSRAAVLDSPLRRPPRRVLEQLTCLSCDASCLCHVCIKAFFDRYAKTPKKTTEAIT